MNAAENPRTIILPPEGMRERSDALTTRRALLRLVFRRPNEVINLADICDELGYEVCRTALHNAVNSLRRDLPIEGVTGSGGGYVLLEPTLPLTAERCVNCRHRTLLSSCKRTRRAEVGLNCRCWGWEALS